MFKFIVQKKLESYVKKYFKKHPDVKLVVVAGSVGKTSTKIAIATILSEHFRVRLHEGNHNTHMSAPLAVLGVEYPSQFRSFKAWRLAFRAAKDRINNPTDVDVIVQELGSDRVGQIPHFGAYLFPDIAVITAVSPEHMEYFHTIDAVAREELSVASFSKQVLINRDDIDSEYAKYLTNPSINTYGTSAAAEYYYISNNYTAKDGHDGLFVIPESTNPTPASIHVIGEHMLRPAIAAGAVASKLGMNATEIARGLAKIRTLPGRMNMLRGVNNTTIIDDTYNSSPLAAQSSLRELYQLPSPQRIAVLGSMNELGETSAMEHEKLGKLCDMNELAWVVTVGDEAEKFLAPAAKSKGCQVRSFKDALQAGAFIHSVLEQDAIILFKGSEGNIYLEEAIKIILHSTDDEKQLVRQSSEWMKRKSKYFEKDFK
jgi:UDP-N-acetylmuramoyl-tripeptide--D-alanyl-D-alanine ligase